MTDFRAFRGLVYDDPSTDEQLGAIANDQLIVPSGCLDSADELERLRLSSPFNAAHLLADPGICEQWIGSGVLRRDDEPALYLYRAGQHLPDGTAVQMTAVSGLFGSGVPTVDDLPSLTFVDVPGLSQLLVPTGTPVAHGTDIYRTHHRLWRLTQTGVINTICEAIDSVGLSSGGRLAFVAESGQTRIDPAFGLVFPG